MRAPALVGIITALHIVAISAFVLIQGCGTSRPTLTSRGGPVEPPPPPVLPPRDIPRPVLKVPTSGAAAPAMSAGATEGSTTYTIQKGDSLSKVAKKFGVSTRELVAFNGIENPDRVRIGQIIQVPGQGGSMPAPPSAPAMTAPSVEVSVAGAPYVVQAGDSLSKIASKYGVKVADLKAANGLASDKILIGQKLVIPGSDGTPAVSAVAAAPSISRPRSSTPVTEEVDALSLTSDESITIEDIDVPVSSGPASTVVPRIPAATTDVVPQNKPIPYTVMEGDDLDEIAKLFIVSKREIMELNGLKPGEALKPGQTIKIPPSAL